MTQESEARYAFERWWALRPDDLSLAKKDCKDPEYLSKRTSTAWIHYFAGWVDKGRSTKESKK